jgi:hypothetical protein
VLHFEGGEGAMSKLIKRKEVLVGKGSAPRLFDRVTIAEEYSKVYISPVDANCQPLSRTNTLLTKL